MDKKKTGELIKDARTRKNYTQSELGELLGVTNKAVSRWETGESFPDIGLLESLSNVLDLKIQDIVVGDVEKIHADDERAFIEIVRMSILQAKAKRNAVIRCAVGIMITLYSCFIGYAGLGNKDILGAQSGMVYLISLAVILMIVLFMYLTAFERNTIEKDIVGKDIIEKDINRKEAAAKEKGKVQKYMFPASVISGIWIIFAVFSTTTMVENGRLPFSMDVSSVGSFLCYQLFAVFLLNLVIMVTGLYRIGKEMEYAHEEVFVSITVLYLAALYADALHRLSAIGEFYHMLLIKTLVVLAELIVFATAAWIIKNVKKTAA